ncbi:putative Oligoendopeptidase F [Paratrimastix pyriformis]|uniref:Oligoendopeptidase F n=1 Tax=Paratrimastix pyriformis TaxID=342808 RepID=A0ABQ8UG04_9EUKA|nr:putative Oligoendopeptidase F [Paratrimastix pyriformis]
MSEIPERALIPLAMRWDLESFLNDEKFEARFRLLDPMVAELNQLKGHLHESAERVAKCLELDDKLSRELTTLHTYASHRADEDRRNQHYLGMSDKMSAKMSKISAETSWMNPELLAMDPAILAQYQRHEALAPWARVMELILRERPHTLSAPEEALLSAASDAFSGFEKTFELLSNADLEYPKIENEKGEEVQLSDGNYILFLQNPNREVRQRAWKAMYNTHEHFKNTFASCLDGQIKVDCLSARVRHHPSALHQALHADNLPVSIYDSLIEAVHAALPHFYKYVGVRQRALKLPTLDMCDMYVPLVEGCDRKVSWEEAVEWVLEAVRPLGPEYHDICVKGLREHRWVDALENKGKKSGAYSGGCYDSHPFILMNFVGNIESVFTLAHELGHSIHSFMSHRAQPHCTSDYRIFVAEVASTLNELLLHDFLVAKARREHDTRLLAFLVNSKCDDFKGTVYRQTMFGEFEKLVHARLEAGEPLTEESLAAIYLRLNSLYYGDVLPTDDAVVTDEAATGIPLVTAEGPHTAVRADRQIRYEWTRIPHFYYNFYVWKYATSFCASLAFHKRLMSGAPDALPRYLGFLSAGCAKDPADILADAGVDLRNPTVITDALSEFGGLVDELDAALKTL